MNCIKHKTEVRNNSYQTKTMIIKNDTILDKIVVKGCKTESKERLHMADKEWGYTAYTYGLWN
jgi:hypothetical protein